MANKMKKGNKLNNGNNVNVSVLNKSKIMLLSVFLIAAIGAYLIYAGTSGVDVKAAEGAVNTAVSSGSGADVVNGSQTIYMNVTSSGWQPNKFVLKKGVPVNWVIDGQRITGCNKAIQVPKLGLKFEIKPGLQTIKFTPNESGTIPWSCWMGMIKGTFIVQDDVTTSGAVKVQEDTSITLASNSGGCGGGGGCGCGGGGGSCGV